MVTKKLAIGICFLSSVLLSSSSGVTTSRAFERGKIVPNQANNNEPRIGWDLARCLLFGGSIFIGTLQEIVGPETQSSPSAAPRNLSYSKVSIAVDQWLYGEPQHWMPTLLLDQVPVVKGLVVNSATREFVWQDVKLKSGKKLLIAFYPATEASGGASQEPLSKINRYGLVVSNQKLFSAIQAVVTTHLRFVSQPEEMLTAPDLLNAWSDNLFAGYLASYFLYNRRQEHPDVEATVISKLIGHSRMLKEYWHLLEIPLTRTMLSEEHPVSEATRNQVTETLLVAGTSSNETLAASALRILVILSDRGKVNVKPFLNDERRQKIIKNYKALITPEAVENKQAVFESQLGLKSN